ncbi:MAG: hypothetical protein WCR04_04280 [Fibrobacteraceae bacterium]
MFFGTKKENLGWFIGFSPWCLILIMVLLLEGCISDESSGTGAENGSFSSSVWLSSSSLPSSSSSASLSSSANALSSSVQMSSSIEDVFSSSSSNIVFDSLPFDTAIASLGYYFYRPVDSLDGYNEGFNVEKNLYYVYPDGMCYVVKSEDGYSHGTYLSTYQGSFEYLIMNGDSLYLGSQESCTGNMWGDCSVEWTYYDAFYRKLVLKSQTAEVFYFAEYPNYRSLLQIDSTHIREWVQYINSCWADAYVNASSLAKKINCDSLYIEKYNLIITSSAWIFENETCRSGFSTKPRSFLSEELCDAYVDDLNNISDCKKRNLNASEIPMLCSGFNDAGWCINYSDSTFIEFMY